HERTALESWKNRLVNLLNPVVFAEDKAGTRAAKGLVSGRRDKVSHCHGIRVQSGRHEAGNMRHVDHEGGADLTADLGKSREINLPRMGAGAGDDQLGAMLARQSGALVEVDPFVLASYSIGDNVVELSREV